jgi:hypothetical protein
MQRFEEFDFRNRPSSDSKICCTFPPVLAACLQAKFAGDLVRSDVTDGDEVRADLGTASRGMSKH